MVRIPLKIPGSRSRTGRAPTSVGLTANVGPLVVNNFSSYQHNSNKCRTLLVFIYVSLICLRVPILLSLPRQLSHLPYSFFGDSVTNLNEPPRALVTSAIAWVRS